MKLATYLPQDRRRALAQGEKLPDRASGAVLFADISGFTLLAKTLRHSFGRRRGAEELSHILDAVYTRLIAAVERYGGSAVNFAGDAIFCWFADGRSPTPAKEYATTTESGHRAVACAAALQKEMAMLRRTPLGESYLALSLKAAVTIGEVRRFVVGDHDHYRLDVLAGRTVVRAAIAEQLARPGEIIVDEAAVRAFGNRLTVREWRLDRESGEQFAVIEPLVPPLPPLSPPPIPDLPADVLKNWIHPFIWQLGQSDHTTLLTEFRPCAALFFHFGGIDYDNSAAALQLDAVTRLLQQIASRYNGLLVDVIAGEKGSYAYLNFGALTVHEDDTRRAAAAALTLVRSVGELGFLEPPQIGLAQGVMRVGTYGSPTRRYYGALGDEPSLAARLMQVAAPGQVLISESVWTAVKAQFQAIPQPLFVLKGIDQPVRAYALIGERSIHQIQRLEPTYAMPIVGREAELETIAARLDLALAGKSQIVAVTGESGIGKSRLIAEAIRLAQQRGFVGYGGACQSDGMEIPYLPWRSIWRALFGLDETLPPTEQIVRLTAVLQEQLPHRLEVLPLLGPLLDLSIPNNNFTAELPPQYRQSALHALLEEALQQAARSSPLLIVLEDLHWLDSLSHELLISLAQATTAYPICFLLAYRLPDTPRLQAPRLEKMANFTTLPLAELPRAEAARLARAKLAQLYPEQAETLFTTLADELLTRAQGNPFFLEELLNYLRDQEIEPDDIANGRRLKLPDSLHALILSRIGQLNVHQKATLRAASIIGRLFPVKWLAGYYPELGNLPQIKADLAKLHALELTLLEVAEPEPVYLFKHVITHEVTYESLPFDVRATLHERLAAYLENLLPKEQLLDSIAYHYGRSQNRAKQIEYYCKAGDAAQAAFANEAALNYFARALPLLEDDPAAQIALHKKRGEIFNLIGEPEQANAAFTAALSLAQTQGDPHAIAECHFLIGTTWTMRDDTQALTWFRQAEERFNDLNALFWLGRVYNYYASIAIRKGWYANAETFISRALEITDQLGNKQLRMKVLTTRASFLFDQGMYEAALANNEEALMLAKALDDKQYMTILLGNIGIAYSIQGLHQEARRFYAQKLALAQVIGNKQQTVDILLNLGLLAHEAGELSEAKTLQEQGLQIAKQQGNNYAIVIALINLGNLAVEQKDALAAQEAYTASLQLAWQTGQQNNLFFSLSGMAATAALAKDFTRAARLAAAAEKLRQNLGTAWDVIEGRIYTNTVADARAQLGEAAFQEAWAEGTQWSLEEAVSTALAVGH